MPSLIARPETSTAWPFPRASENISVFRWPSLVTGWPIRIFHRLETPQTGHFSITDSSRVELVRIQNSIVKSFVPKLPTVLPKLSRLSVPSKLNAPPTIPSLNVTPFNQPLLPPTKSVPSPSPFHQLTRPTGAGKH